MKRRNIAAGGMPARIRVIPERLARFAVRQLPRHADVGEVCAVSGRA
jgi:hypothetical protein